MKPQRVKAIGTGCLAVFLCLIGVPHLVGGTLATLTGPPMAVIFIVSGTLLCTIAGVVLGYPWRNVLTAVAGAIAAMTLGAFAATGGK